MARGKSTKLLATLPDTYSSDWLTRLDKRTKVAKAVIARISELESDAGGAESLSAARRSLIRHAAWLDAIVESYEMGLAAGAQVDVGGFTQSLNSLLGLFRLLGLERQAKPAEDLHAYTARIVAERAAAEAAAEAESGAEANADATVSPDEITPE